VVIFGFLWKKTSEAAILERHIAPFCSIVKAAEQRQLRPAGACEFRPS
jgi:hypothetical protein